MITDMAAMPIAPESHYCILDAIAQPSDVRNLEVEQLPALAAAVRAELLQIVAANGGHLASNMGVVELTVALLHVFVPEQDCIVWDTGHQAYAYKLLTGRRQLLKSLRQDNGCCGFPNRGESVFDHFGAGHAGTAISAALGMAAARDQRRESNRIIAVVGDGALGCGSSLEGLNNIIETTDDFLLILNDNKMSIAPNVGALARYLNRLISGQSYNRFKQRLRSWVRQIPAIGPWLQHCVHKLQEATKHIIVPGGFFAELGLRYLGPIDGHNLDELVQTLQAIKHLRGPMVLHVLTEKGHGYSQAQAAPEIYHGTSSFDLSSGKPLPSPAAEAATPPSFTDGLGTSLCQLMAENPQIVAITAGMCMGTGLNDVRRMFPERVYDVGICEEHAVVFAAGMATRGLLPVVIIYASFMQRAMDYVFHDVCLQNLPVIFCLDRAGVVDDGPTHHGIHDYGFWRTIPNISVLQPSDADELGQMLHLLVDRRAPAVLRYPKAAAAPLRVTKPRTPLQWGKAEVLRSGDDLAIWAVGREADTALAVAAALAASTQLEATVVNARFCLPLDAPLLCRHAERMPIVTLENHVVRGGFAEQVAATVAGIAGVQLRHCGWPCEVLPWGSESGIRRRYGMSAEQLAVEIAEFCRKKVTEQVS